MKREVARGALWMLAEVGGGEGLAFVVFLVLTRLLGPADYGVASVAGAFIAFAQIPIMRGLADGVVALGDLDEDAISAAFWTTLLIAVSLCVGVEFGAGGIAWAYGQPLLAPLLRWLAVCLMTTALTSVPLAVLRRHLRFSAFALRAAGAGVVGGIVGISMALAGSGIWALVGYQIAQGIASVAIIWSTGDWRPRLTFSLASLRPLSEFSIHALSGAALDTLGSKLDLLIVGWSFDATSVGYYYLVKRILQTAAAATIYPAWAVSLPVLGKFAADRVRFNAAYVSIVTTAQACWLPVVLGFGIMAAGVIPLLFGAHWNGAAPVAAAASLSSLSWAAVICANQALCAAARADLYARLALAQLSLMGLFFAVAGRLNVTAAGYALSLSLAAMVPLQLWALRRVTGLAPADFLAPVGRVVAAGGVMAAAILVTGMAAATAPALLRLPLQIAAGAVGYFAGLWMLARSTCLEVRGLVQAGFARGSAIGAAEGSGGADV